LLARPAGSVGVAICYELSDGAALAAASRDGATWLLATANLDPYPLMLQRQFEALARLRAMETGRWLVSSANTGPSLLVSPRGEVIARLAPGGASMGLFQLGRSIGNTGYVRWGEAPLRLAIVLAGLVRWGDRGPGRGPGLAGLNRRTEEPPPRG
jgi:apolipoprotein N-acyltransferase